MCMCMCMCVYVYVYVYIYLSSTHTYIYILVQYISFDPMWVENIDTILDLSTPTKVPTYIDT